MLRSAFFALATACTLVGAAFAQEAQPRSTTREAWRALALTDLEAAREALGSQTLRHHQSELPAMV
jgi:hypothetical protein